ncbi:multidrug resistance-associated protein 5-like [Pollicipes pollicipes]|uniref:multidrug resistance-associated protein 5-like n=1 Tax=Pollicipes pollicipes TaxID=41117 RepID=UPI001884A8F4|nr:multidrug resistance-associated protein 5-like [Pollicipes pollicipes]
MLRKYAPASETMSASVCHQYLSQCDEVLMMKEGRLVERGTHAELMGRRGEYFKLVSYDTTTSAHQAPSEHLTPGGTTEEEVEKIKKRLTGEESFVPKLGFFSLLYLYMKPAGLAIMMVVVLLIILFGVSRSANGVYLQYWLDTGDGLMEERLRNQTEYNMTYTAEQLVGVINDNPDLHQHMIIYSMMAVVMCAIGVVKGLGVALRVIKGATAVHNRMFDGLMRCKMSFFDANPGGRILNRFSRDLDELDNKIPMLFEFLLQGGAMILSQFLIPTASFPEYIVLVIVVLALYFFLGRGLISGIRETKHVENLMRSPVVHHITSTVAGLPVIRTFGREEVFTQRFEELLDRHTSSNLQFRLSSVWFCLRLDELGTVMITAVALFVVFARDASPAMVGLCLSVVYGSVTFVSFWIRMTAELSARLTSVERCDEYIRSLDYEAPLHVPERAPPASWPQRGGVELRGVCLRYRPELPRVLHDISLQVQPGEKVGVVGRTGAGKSTLISTLLRMVEVETGTILIDGLDIRPMGLHDLRSRIDVIPQDPVLFSGTIRHNLDPFDEYPDEKLWTILEKANLKKKVSRADQQLQMKVTSVGDNFSVGEKQLICLARALLRQNRILLLDEATASVDVETDHLIQRTIQDNFSACTVITIAHRLNTVVGYDRIVVMDAGKVVELDTPLALMENESSLFRQMMGHAGFTTVEQLLELQNKRR